MHRFAWVLTLPLTIFLVLFAVSNRQMHAFSLYPLAQEIDLPIFLPIVFALFLGFLAGAFYVWNGQRAYRRKARTEAKRADKLELQQKEDLLKEDSEALFLADSSSGKAK